MSNIKFGSVRLMAARLAETLTAGLIPSLMAVWTVIMKTEDKTWHIAVTIVFVMFIVIDCCLLKRHVMEQRRDELQLSCALVNMLYGIAAAIMSQYIGSTIFSMVFAPLRVFEAFGIGTRNSIIFSTLLTAAVTAVFLAVVCGRHGRAVEYMRSMYAEDETNPNAGYGAGELFSVDAGDRAYKPAEPGEMPSVNPNEEYDSGNLFNIPELRERYVPAEPGEMPSVNPNEEYDSGKLFNIPTLRKRYVPAEPGEMPSVNPNEEYDSGNLWSAGMKQGRQNPNT